MSASRIVKVVLSCVAYAAIEISLAARRTLGIATPPIRTVICYHHTFDHERSRFARQMDHLLRWCEPVSARITNQLAPGRRYVSVTADDGWLSFLRNALPEILSRRIPITIFLITGRLGEAIEEDKADRLVARGGSHIEFADRYVRLSYDKAHATHPRSGGSSDARVGRFAQGSNEYT
jgi:hypothetical protein